MHTALRQPAPVPGGAPAHRAAAGGAHLRVPIGSPLPLAEIAAAHDLVDSDNRRRVVLDVTA